ncbi:hypothetical protein RJ640_001489 [Escallonia rubra]|uniref:FAE domain-containing protein n=1 Tax=Escallonia rubra TaxID=112253 RepID=A0AA88QCC7_9ASTE|nr:hypothetical protein RJ640_001489 [Escallonia rubra]
MMGHGEKKEAATAGRLSKCEISLAKRGERDVVGDRKVEQIDGDSSFAATAPDGEVAEAVVGESLKNDVRACQVAGYTQEQVTMKEALWLISWASTCCTGSPYTSILPRSSPNCIFVIFIFTSVVVNGGSLDPLESPRSPFSWIFIYACYRPPNSNRIPMSMFIKHVLLEKQFDDTNIDFQTKILEKSSFSEETCLHPSICRLPRTRSLSLSIKEAATVMFSMVADLLQKKDISPKAIDILITNCSIYCPTPSLSAMVINKFKMRSNIMGYNLSGMGCSAGIIAVGLAKDLLRAHPNSLALIVSSEILSQDWYDGKDRSMLLTNCLFRMGGAALLLSSRVIVQVFAAAWVAGKVCLRGKGNQNHHTRCVVVTQY